MPLVTAPPHRKTPIKHSTQGQRLRRAASSSGVNCGTIAQQTKSADDPKNLYGSHPLRNFGMAPFKRTIEALDLATLPKHPHALRTPVTLLSMRPCGVKEQKKATPNAPPVPPYQARRNFENLMTQVREDRVSLHGKTHFVLTSQSDAQRYLLSEPLFNEGHRSLIHVGRNMRGGMQWGSVWKVFKNEPHARTNAAGETTWHSNVREALIRREVDIAHNLNSPFSPIGVFQSRDKIYVQYPVARGELSLYIRIAHNNQESFGDKERRRSQKLLAEHIMLQLLPQISRMHERNVAHHDIKANNIFVDEWCNLHLADFGSALTLNEAPESGTWKHQRPEAFTEKHYDACADDLWALGKMGLLALLGPRADPFTLPYSEGPNIFAAKAHNARIADEFLQRWKHIHGQYCAWLKRYHAYRDDNTQASQKAFSEPLPQLLKEPPGTRINEVFSALARVDTTMFWFGFMLTLFEPATTNTRSAAQLNKWAQRAWGAHFVSYAPDKDLQELNASLRLMPKEERHKARVGYNKGIANTSLLAELFNRDDGAAFKRCQAPQLTNVDLEELHRGMQRQEDYFAIQNKGHTRTLRPA